MLTSPFYFQSLYAWNFVSRNRYKVFDDHLCLIAEDMIAREIFALPPLGIPGDSRFALAVEKIFVEFVREDLPCLFREVPGFMLPYFFSLDNYKMEIYYERDWSDYVFSRDDFIATTEKKSAKEAIRHFCRHHNLTI